MSPRVSRIVPGCPLPRGRGQPIRGFRSPRCAGRYKVQRRAVATLPHGGRDDNLPEAGRENSIAGPSSFVCAGQPGDTGYAGRRTSRRGGKHHDTVQSCIGRYACCRVDTFGLRHCALGRMVRQGGVSPRPRRALRISLRVPRSLLSRPVNSRRLDIHRAVRRLEHVAAPREVGFPQRRTAHGTSAHRRWLSCVRSARCMPG